MSRPPHARDGVVRAFAEILASDGERAATMDATARAAGVSKGGLLYHFASKEALEAGLIEHMESLVQEDIQHISDAEDGLVAAFVRTSIYTGSELDLFIVAVSRLAQAGNAAAVDALVKIRKQWETAVRPHVRDDAALNLVMLVSDGLYFNNALGFGPVAGSVPTGKDLDALVGLVRSAAVEQVRS